MLSRVSFLMYAHSVLDQNFPCVWFTGGCSCCGAPTCPCARIRHDKSYFIQGESYRCWWQKGC